MTYVEEKCECASCAESTSSTSLSTDFNKDPWRRRNLQFLQSVFRGKMPGTYVEYLGKSGGESYKLLKDAKLLRSPKNFVGFDTSADVIFHHWYQQSPFRYALGDINVHGPVLIREDIDPVVALCYDTTHKLASSKVEDTLTGLHNNVSACVLRTPTVAAILNFVFDRNVDHDHTRFKTFTQTLASLFKPAWMFDVDHFLRGTDIAFEKRFLSEDGGFAGPFDIYKSANGKLRMATVRLKFDQPTRRITWWTE